MVTVGESIRRHRPRTVPLVTLRAHRSPCLRRRASTAFAEPRRGTGERRIEASSPPLGATYLAKIVRANSGIADVDALTGRTVRVLNRGVDSDLEAWLEVWVDHRVLLVYERDLELISRT